MFINFSSEFFKNLVSHLKTIEYCIIGDHDNLPNSVNHDLDFWTNDLPKFHQILVNTCKDLDFRILMLNKTGNGFNIAVFRKQEDGLCLMKIDVMSNCSYKSLFTIASSSLFSSHTQQKDSFYVSDEFIESFVHLCYPLLEWGRVKNKYHKEILNNIEKAGFVKNLVKLFGKKKARKLHNLITEEAWDKVAKLHFKLKKQLLLRSVFRINFPIVFLKFLMANIMRILKPSGYLLAFTGLDGAGKTTVIHHLENLFVETFKKKKVVSEYWRPYVIPELKKVANLSSNKDDSIPLEAEEREPRGKLISLIKLGYYVFDYILGALKYLKCRNLGGVVLFDRHYLDLIIHPQRFEMNLPKSIFRIAFKLIKKPDLTFFFWASPDVIHSRKVEFSKEEIIKQTELYMQEGSRQKGFYALETNTTIEEEVHEILVAMSEFKRF